MNVLVTGSKGFVGRHLCRALSAAGLTVIEGTRRPEETSRDRLTPELNSRGDWSNVLRGVDVVVHLAGRAHIISDSQSQIVEETYKQINADGTECLALQARDVGVKHFVFLSSCHAVASSSDTVLSAATKPRPDSAYGRSKLAAEQRLARCLNGSGTGWTILRPPLVYGPGNLANFARLVALVRTGLPLPFGGIKNHRSFIGVNNLVDVIQRCIAEPAALGKCYYPSDCRTLSTPELIREIAASLGRHARLFPISESWLSAAAGLPGLGMLGKLMSSLSVSSDELQSDLRWSPPFTLAQGLAQIDEFE